MSMRSTFVGTRIYVANVLQSSYLSPLLRSLLESSSFFSRSIFIAENFHAKTFGRFFFCSGACAVYTAALWRCAAEHSEPSVPLFSCCLICSGCREFFVPLRRVKVVEPEAVAQATAMPFESIRVTSRVYEGQKPGTSGLRKAVKVFQQRHYTENFVQCILTAVGAKLRGCTLAVGGDGRFFGREAVDVIVKIAAANGVSNELRVGCS